MQRKTMCAWRLALALVTVLTLTQKPAGAEEFTRDFRLEDCVWSAWGNQNPYFSLRPGRQLVLEGEEDGAEIRTEITALRQLEVIHFTTREGVPITVVARVVEEREFEDGEIVEVSRNWYSRCVQTSDIFYFGEEVDIYEDGELVNHHGAWRAGENGALPGVMMPGTFLLGSRYYQEVAPGVAEDRAEHIDMGLVWPTPAGTFVDCVAIEETNALSPGDVGEKIYCPWVGIVQDEALELVETDVVPPGA